MAKRKLNVSNDRQPKVPHTRSPWTCVFPDSDAYPGSPKVSDRGTVESPGVERGSYPGSGYPGRDWQRPCRHGASHHSWSRMVCSQ